MSMPSLFSRFLGKKKSADPSPLLDGEKFEAVSKSTSPSAPTFGESAPRTKPKEREREKGKRPKRSPAGPYDSQISESVPVLSLSLPDAKDEEKKSQGLGVVFEGITDGPKTLDDVALGEKRLSPSETLVLVQKTSEVLTERGLETLGVMRPHWFASPRQQEIQLKLIHRFLATLDSQKPNSPPSSPTPQSAFESELRYSRDPHDVAAVLRWGLRHLQLEGNSFASSNVGDWYRKFADTERSGSYPTKAFDDILVPLLPAPHTDLLRATLDMVSSLAAHSEENGISGNKLSKVLGWWVVSSRNIQGARWPEFYAQWEAAARQFEHLFLAYIRAQDAQSRMPKRLTELVRSYPFAKNRREEDGIYLPRSRFSTRSADALFVQLTVNKSAATPRPHPLRLVEDAFRASAEGETTGVYATFWEEIRRVASESAQPGDKAREEGAADADSSLNLTAILADESIRLFSLVPTPDDAAAPTLSLFTPLPPGRRSRSADGRSPASSTANGRPQSLTRESTSHSKAATSPPYSTQGYGVATDWQAFSSSGFESPSGLSLAASLWDNDTEVSQPTSKKPVGIGKRNSKTSSSRRRSSEQPTPTRPVVDSPKSVRRTYGAPRMITVDEAFIDFWADSLLDSIAGTWPTFVICQLKPLPALKRAEDGKPVEWLIIERVTDEPTRPIPSPIKTSASARASSPLPSPTTSEGSRSYRWSSSTLSAARKRFSFFSSSRHETAPAAQGGRDRAAKKAAKEAKVGELGEILKEEDEAVQNGVKTNGTEKLKTPEKSAEKPQEPPKIQVNGVSKPEEAANTIPTKVSARQEPPVVPSEPVSTERPPEPGPLPTGETSVPKQLEDPAAQESVQPSQPQPASGEAVETLHTAEVQAEPSQDSVSSYAPTTEVPAITPVQNVVPEPQAAAPAVEEASPAPATNTVASVEPVDDIVEPATKSDVPIEHEPVEEPASSMAPAPAHPAPASASLAPASASPVPAPAPPAPVSAPPAPAPEEDQVVPPPAPAPEADQVVQPEPEPEATAPQTVTQVAPEDATSEPHGEAATGLSAIPQESDEQPSAAATSQKSAPDVIPPQAELPAVHQQTPGPDVDHIAPPVDEDGPAQTKQPAATENDDVEPSTATPEDDAEPIPPPSPHLGAQDSADNVEPALAAVPEDAAKADADDQQASQDETHPDEHPSQVVP